MNKKNSLNNSDEIIDRIITMMKKNGMTKAELGRRINASRASVGVFLQKKRKNLDVHTLSLISNALNCDPFWLQYGKMHNVRNGLQENNPLSTSANVEFSNVTGRIDKGKPVLKLHEAHMWRNSMEKALQDETRNNVLVYPDNAATISSDYIPILVEGDAMLPDFKRGDVVILDPHRKAKITNYVVAHLHETNENIFAQYFIAEDNKAIFKFTNSEYPVIVDADKFDIVGVAYESRRTWI